MDVFICCFHTHTYQVVYCCQRALANSATNNNRGVHLAFLSLMISSMAPNSHANGTHHTLRSICLWRRRTISTSWSVNMRVLNVRITQRVCDADRNWRTVTAVRSQMEPLFGDIRWRRVSRSSATAFSSTVAPPPCRLNAQCAGRPN